MTTTLKRQRQKTTTLLMAIIILVGLVASTNTTYHTKTNPHPDNSLAINEAETKVAPPRVEEDKGRRKLAFGDSTMALADSKREVSANTCIHEKGTWVSRLGGITNLSCSGSTIKEAIKEAEKTEYLTEKTAQVFITTSSNDYLYGAKQKDIDKDLEQLFTTIREKSQGVHIIVVGYTKVKTDRKCMGREEITRAQEINNQHKKANSSLKKALSDKDTYIDIYNIDYDICNKKTTMVRLPETTKGSNWHTTGVGHKIISEKIIHDLTKKKQSDKNKSERENNTQTTKETKNDQPQRTSNLP